MRPFVRATEPTISRYLLGDDDPELARLHSQHAVWSHVTQAGWDRAGLTRGMSVLDVGCGPGFTTLELAERVGPRGKVVGIDQSDRFVAQLRAELARRAMEQCEVRQLDLRELPNDIGEFDLIYARWIFCFLPEPEAALRALARHLKPGGALLIFDYTHYQHFALAPRVEVMAEVVEAISTWWRSTGGSLDVQSNLPPAALAAGLEIQSLVQPEVIARPGEPLWHWPERFLREFLPELVAEHFLNHDQLDRFWAGWEQTAKSGGFLFLPPLLELIARRPR